MRQYGSRREDNDFTCVGGLPECVHGTKSSRARAKREAERAHRGDEDLRHLERELSALPEFCTRECCSSQPSSTEKP